MTAGRSGEETGSRSGPEADGGSAHGFGNAYGSGNDGEHSSGENGSGDGPEAAGSPPPGARRPGGRTARVREQVLGAVGPLLVEHGFDGLTVDAVAARSGVHRATVYRRWRDVGGLLADVLDAAGDDGWRPADTGSLEGDLRALNEEVQEALTEEPSVALALIAASFRSEEAARALRRFWEERYARCEAVVGRAVERGELSPPVDARKLVVSSTAPLYHQRVLLHSEPDPGLPAEAARTAALAARAGAFNGAPATPQPRATP
ncbi:TetR/AcrR family transcriptional regulator [Streptomyces smyrnaeus]|uniref:TetR/AcrR family transcriptional regulator n=1 Tax=Streptomyces smyrnaeus TaxID=1387713 RepID=UPI003405F40A